MVAAGDVHVEAEVAHAEAAHAEVRLAAVDRAVAGGLQLLGQGDLVCQRQIA
jgi:hypothetical protein